MSGGGPGAPRRGEVRGPQDGTAFQVRTPRFMYANIGLITIRGIVLVIVNVYNHATLGPCNYTTCGHIVITAHNCDHEIRTTYNCDHVVITARVLQIDFGAWDLDNGLSLSDGVVLGGTLRSTM